MQHPYSALGCGAYAGLGVAITVPQLTRACAVAQASPPHLTGAHVQARPSPGTNNGAWHKPSFPVLLHVMQDTAVDVCAGTTFSWHRHGCSKKDSIVSGKFLFKTKDDEVKYCSSNLG